MSRGHTGRRGFLALSGSLVTVAGCLGKSSSWRRVRASLPGIRVENHDEVEREVEIELLRVEDRVVALDDAVTLPSEGAHEYEAVVEAPGTYRVAVAVDGEDASTYDWTVPGDGEGDLPRNSRTLGVEVYDRSTVEFSEAVA